MKAAALELGLPVAHRVEDVLEAGADLGVVVAYGRLIRRPVLERLGFVNLHFSLLPRWRGAAPVERALLAGDAETGVCLMQLEEGLDTGPVFAHRRVPIDTRVTAAALRRQLVEVGSELLCTTLDTGLHDPTPQEGEVTYAAKLDAGRPRDRLGRGGRRHRPRRARRRGVDDVAGAAAQGPRRRAGRRGRARGGRDGAGGPAPGALIGDEVATGSGRLRLLTVQPEGKPAMAAAAWRHGAHPGPADRLGA